MHKEGCTLKWSPPLDDGGAPIDHYLVEKLDTETGRWMPAAKTKDPKAELENLVPGHEYKFRVSAVNNEGQSEPLEAEHSIIAKNPFGKRRNPSGSNSCQCIMSARLMPMSGSVEYSSAIVI